MTDPSTIALERCPHCGSDAKVQRHAALRYVCRACGKPRIPMDVRLATTDAPTKHALGRAYRERLARFAWHIGAVGAGLAALVLGALGAGASALFDFGAFGNVTLLALLAVPSLIAVSAWIAGNKANARSTKELQEAWRLGASRVFASSGGRISADALAAGMGIPLDEATELLAEAEVSQFLGAVDGGGGPRLRIDTSSPETPEQAAERELAEALGNAPTQHFPSVKRHDE